LRQRLENTVTDNYHKEDDEGVKRIEAIEADTCTVEDTRFLAKTVEELLWKIDTSTTKDPRTFEEFKRDGAEMGGRACALGGAFGCADILPWHMNKGVCWPCQKADREIVLWFLDNCPSPGNVRVPRAKGMVLRLPKMHGSGES